MGGNLKGKWQSICDWIKETQPDIVMLQETKIKQRDEVWYRPPPGYKILGIIIGS